MSRRIKPSCFVEPFLFSYVLLTRRYVRTHRLGTNTRARSPPRGPSRRLRVLRRVRRPVASVSRFEAPALTPLPRTGDLPRGNRTESAPREASRATGRAGTLARAPRATGRAGTLARAPQLG